MSIKTSILIEADGEQAKDEIEKVEQAVKKTGAATEDMSRKARTGAAGTKDLGGAAGQAGAKVETLAAAERRAAAAAGEMERANRRASGATANLVSQGNDIMVMLAAGQNPIQLALQQGTQINQVFSQLGGGMGALRGIGSAVMAMISPMSLLTIGTIAGGAALVQWGRNAFGAGENAGTAAERVDALVEAIDTYAASAKAANAPTDEMITKFGSLGTEARKALEEIAAADLQRSLSMVESNLGSIAAAGERDLGRYNTNRWSPELDQELSLAALQRGIGQAEGADAQVAALEKARDAMAGVVAEGGRLTTGQQEFLSLVNQTIVEIARLKDLQAEAAKAPPPDFGLLADLEVNAERLALVEAVAAAEAEYATEQSIAAMSANQSARDMLDALESQAELKELVALYGADSAQVAEHHLDAEREVQQALVESMEVSESMKTELMAAWEAANGISAADMAAGIGAAANEAYRLTGNLIAAVNAQNRADFKGGTYSGRGDGSAERNLLGGGLNSEGEGYANPREYLNSVDNDMRLALRELNRAPRTGRKGGGGGKSDAEKARGDAAREAEREQKAVDNLIGSLQEEVDVQRLLSPLQQEMRRNRDVLASATEAERAQVEQLIGIREAEAAAMALVEEQTELFRNTGMDLFQDLTDGSGSFGDALGSISDRIRELALESMLLGEGPLAGLLGGGNAAGGGLLGMVASALIPGLGGSAAAGLPRTGPVPIDGSLYADGGLIHGPGGGRSDDVPIWASSGEFMMNAKATAQHRHLLEAMNAGAQLPGFARGGAIDGSAAASFMAPQVTFIDQSTGSKIVDREDTVDAQGRPQTKFTLANAVGEALTTKGGGARHALMRGYGVRPRGTLR